MPSDWSITPQDQGPMVITPFSPESLGPCFIGTPPANSAVWPGVDHAIYVPFVASTPMAVQNMGVYNGATVSGNFDIGIYDDQQNLIAHSGSTAQAGTTQWQVVAVSAAFDPGVYYMALAFDNTTATTYGVSGGQASDLRALGVLTQTLSSVTLPSSATFAAAGDTRIPAMMLTQAAVF